MPFESRNGRTLQQDVLKRKNGLSTFNKTKFIESYNTPGQLEIAHSSAQRSIPRRLRRILFRRDRRLRRPLPSDVGQICGRPSRARRRPTGSTPTTRCWSPWKQILAGFRFYPSSWSALWVLRCRTNRIERERNNKLNKDSPLERTVEINSDLKGWKMRRTRNGPKRTLWAK